MGTLIRTASSTSNDRDVSQPSRTRELALNIGAIAGLVCIIAAATSMFLGIKPLIFRSGSMEPAISTGALALTAPVAAEDLAVGDVASVVTPGDVRITHRVTELAAMGDDGAVAVTMRGDANNAPDPSPYVVGVADRVFFHVSGLGYVVAWLTSPVAIFLGGMMVGALCVIAFGRSRENDDEVGSDPDRETDRSDAVQVGMMEGTDHE